MSFGINLLMVLLLAASLLASLFGQGGGVLYTPIQVWTGVGFHNAAATSLFLIIVTSLSATLVFRKAHEVDWPMALAMEIPTTAGAFLGGVTSHWIPEKTLMLLLAGLITLAAFFMIRPISSRADRQSAPKNFWVWQHAWNGQVYSLNLALMFPLMATVGLLTSMTGIGGGVLKVPVMVVLFGVPMHIAVGSSAFMVGLTATAGLLGHATMGHWYWQASLLLAAPVFIGGLIGSRISVRLGTRKLTHWFGYFLPVVALFTALHAVKQA